MLAIATLLTACGDSGHAPDQDGGQSVADAPASPASADPGRDSSGDGPGIDAVLGLLPAARIDGNWVGGGRDGECTATTSGTTCPAGSAGQVVVDIDGALQTVRFDATEDVVLEAVALEGAIPLPDTTAWLSQGFQSWSQSGVVALADAAPSDEAIEAALLAEGDAETLREGHELSWWHTWIASPTEALVAGAVDASRFKATARAHREDGGIWLTLQSGGTGEAVPVAAGSALVAETWFVRRGPGLTELLDAFADHLPSRRDRAERPAEVGWNSWYDLWQHVDETDIRANAALLHGMLDDIVPADAPPLRVVVDDGWQQAWGLWQPNDKFPSGIDGLVADLEADGFETGIWFAPLLVHETTQLALDHPDWFVPGKLFPHLIEGKMLILDPFHPDVEAHLREVTSRIVSWGIDMLKIDFLFAGTWEAPRHEAGRTGTEALVRALSIIREAAGEETIILAVGGPPTPALPYVDSWRNGGDIAVEVFGPTWPFAANQLRSVAARYPYCRRTLCDADPLLLRQMPRDEVDALALIVAAAGGAFFLSDDLTALDPQRLDWLPTTDLIALAVGSVPAVAEDWVPSTPPETLVTALGDQISGTSSHAVPVVWRFPNGSRVAFNVGAAAITVEGTEVPPHAARTLEPAR